MNPSRFSTLVIRTPEGIAFSLPLACPVTRCLAWIIDFACVMAAITVLNIIVRLAAIISSDLARALTVILFFALQIGYPMVCEWYFRGQTLGKRALRLRVMDAQGLHLRFNQIALRNLLRMVDQLPLFYLVGGVTSLCNARGQRLGDLVANTIVVRHLKIPAPDVDQLMAGKYNSLRGFPHLEARLRQRVSAREATLALQALLRRDELEPQARLELFDQLAAHFRGIVTFPSEATDGVAAEQYVRNVVDILFRVRGPNAPTPAKV